MQSFMVLAAIAGAQDRVTHVSDREGNREIYVVSAEGAEAANLTGHLADNWYPAWSPDGNRLAFTSSRDGAWDIYVRAPDASVKRLTKGDWNGHASWSPDGGSIAYHHSSDQGGSWGIRVMRSDGTGARAITEGEAGDRCPAWSPKGKRIAFESNREGGLDVFVMNADGSAPKNLTRGKGKSGGPSWSPDGARICFYSDRSGKTQIYLMDTADGSNVAAITPAASDSIYPAWSPDGKKIAFYSGRDGGWDLYVMDADGKGVKRLTKDSAARVYCAPAFGG